MQLTVSKDFLIDNKTGKRSKDFSKLDSLNSHHLQGVANKNIFGLHDRVRFSRYPKENLEGVHRNKIELRRQYFASTLSVNTLSIRCLEKLKTHTFSD